MKIIFFPILCIPTAFFLLSCTHNPPLRVVSSADSVYSMTSDIAWVEYAPKSTYLARVVTQSSVCPLLTADAATITMQKRSILNAQDYPALVCETQIPSSVAKLSVNGESLPLPKKEPKRILIIGDTGCQIKSKGGKVISQGCNDQNAWPFAKVAESAAKWKPDLVIHVGDYHYREIPCQNEASCGGAISGDNLGSWAQDFFIPAAPLLKQSPWIFIRGNHELCERAGTGWFNLLDPRETPSACVNESDPYSILVGDHEVLVVDSATDMNINPSLAKIPSPPGLIRWLALHRPFLTAGADDETTTQSRLPEGMQKPGMLSLVLTGHQHRLSLNTFPDERPPELISGNGGTVLEIEKGIDKPLAHIQDSDHQAKIYSDFGFMTLERTDKFSWNLVVHDRNGNDVLKCSLKESATDKTQLLCP